MAMGTTLSSATSAQQPVKDNTQLESHLFEIRSLHEELSGAATRARSIADRLMGSEPTNLPSGAGIAKAPADPPLLSRLSEAMQLAKELAQQINYHLNRLEKL